MESNELPKEPSMLDILSKYINYGKPLLEFHQQLLRDGQSPFSKGEREMIAAYTSGLNACEYCYRSHTVIAETFGIREDLIVSMLNDLETSGVDSKFIPVLNFAKKLTEEPAKISDTDRMSITEAGWPDSTIFHVSAICGLFNLMNRIAEGMGCVLSLEGLKLLESPEFSPGSDSENIQSIRVLSFGNEFREVMAVRVNQEKFRKGIA